MLGQGKIVIFTAIDGMLAGAIALADIVQPEPKQAIAALKRVNIRCLVLTSNNKQAAKWISEQIGKAVRGSA